MVDSTTVCRSNTNNVIELCHTPTFIRAIGAYDVVPSSHRTHKGITELINVIVCALSHCNFLVNDYVTEYDDECLGVPWLVSPTCHSATPLYGPCGMHGS